MSDIFWIVLSVLLGIPCVIGVLAFAILGCMMQDAEKRHEHENTYR